MGTFKINKRLYYLRLNAFNRCEWVSECMWMISCFLVKYAKCILHSYVLKVLLSFQKWQWTFLMYFFFIIIHQFVWLHQNRYAKKWLKKYIQYFRTIFLNLLSTLLKTRRRAHTPLQTSFHYKYFQRNFFLKIIR